MSELNNSVELNLEDMEQVSGGYKRPPEKQGFTIYKIQKGENLTRIAQKYGCTVEQLLAWNPKITNRNLIYSGDYLYIRVR